MVCVSVFLLTVVCCGVTAVGVVSVMFDSIAGCMDCVGVAVDNVGTDPLVCVDVIM